MSNSDDSGTLNVPDPTAPPKFQNQTPRKETDSDFETDIETSSPFITNPHADTTEISYRGESSLKLQSGFDEVLNRLSREGGKKLEHEDSEDIENPNDINNSQDINNAKDYVEEEFKFRSHDEYTNKSENEYEDNHYDDTQRKHKQYEHKKYQDKFGADPETDANTEEFTDANSDISNHSSKAISNNMDASVASLRELLSNLKTDDDSSGHRDETIISIPDTKEEEENFHNSTINTTARFDDTQVQLSQDMTFSMNISAPIAPTSPALNASRELPSPKVVTTTASPKITLSRFSPKITAAKISPKISFGTPNLPSTTLNPSPKIQSSPAKSVSRANHRSTASTSWGKFRPSSTYFEETPNIQAFNPNAKAILKNSFQSHDSTTSAKIDDLNKQITGYRIQIKFFKQFLQNLIDKTRLQTGDSRLDLNELAQFQKNFNGLSMTLQGSSEYSKLEGDYTKLEGDYNNLLKNYDEVFKLNEDLYDNLETFQNQLQSKDIQLQKLNEYIDSSCKIIDEILQTLIENPNTDNPTRQALSKCLESNGTRRSLELKLQVISFEFNKLINSSSPRLPMQRFSSPQSSATTQTSYGAPSQNSFDAETRHVDVIKGLIASINKLENEFEHQKEETVNLKDLLAVELKESNLIRQKNILISTKFKNLCTSIENDQMFVDKRELANLRTENQRLVTANQAVDAKFDEYQNIIDMLQEEVKEFSRAQKRHDHKNRSGDSSITEQDLQTELIESHKSLNVLHKELSGVLDKYDKLKMDSTATISSLTNELHVGQQDIQSLKAEGRVSEKSKQELDNILEKQKLFKAENIRLNYKIESLSSERESLQSTIRSLTDKLTLLTVQGESTNSSISTTSTASSSGMLTIMEQQFRDLLLLDVHEFQKLLKSFNKIADDSSVKDPTRKIDNLSKRLFKINESRKYPDGSPWDINEYNLIKDLHKSIFDYFARAVEMIVNDHVKLLLTESESNKQAEEYVEKLHKRIDELNDINDSLLKQLEVYDNNDMDSSFGRSSSPRTKLRMDELWNRWKSEREARVYEGKQADRRLKELETENSRLRSELSKMAS